MWNKLLDISILFSFDQSGFVRHSRHFKDDLQFTFGEHAIITGGTSGIGLQTAIHLADQGVHTIVTGRTAEKGENAVNDKNNLSFIQWDIVDWHKIPKYVKSLSPMSYVVLNAGGMPEEFKTNKNGVELQFASQLFGHYFLIKELKKQNKLKLNARIVWVTSGGMYLSQLNLENIFDNEKYDKVSTYANVKRAQVTLLSYLKKEFSQQYVTAMHPGWVDTQALKEAIPNFKAFMNDRLRLPAQGADTILWLLSSNTNPVSGELYFDRRIVKKHFFSFTKKSDKKIDKLLSIIESIENKVYS